MTYMPVFLPVLAESRVLLPFLSELSAVDSARIQRVHQAEVAHGNHSILVWCSKALGHLKHLQKVKYILMPSYIPIIAT